MHDNFFTRCERRQRRIRIFKAIAFAILLMAAAYIGYFELWVIADSACVQKYGADKCGGDMMTASIKAGYGWILK
jgi:hypothetical protein